MEARGGDELPVELPRRRRPRNLAQTELRTESVGREEEDDDHEKEDRQEGRENEISVRAQDRGVAEAGTDSAAETGAYAEARLRRRPGRLVWQGLPVLRRGSWLRSAGDRRFRTYLIRISLYRNAISLL